MTILIDTDILLDIALKREPFFKNSALIIDFSESRKISGFIAWHSLSNFYYLIAPSSGKKKTKQFLIDLLEFVSVAPVNTISAKKAFALNAPDFEDALQMSAAIECNADYIVTRNLKHYKYSPVKALSPKMFLNLP